MPQGLPVSMGTATLSTTETANQIQNTYDYAGAGKYNLYVKASTAGTTLVNFFISGKQICRRLVVPFAGTQGTLSTSDNLVASVNTLGGRLELTFVATTGTPTVDWLVTFEPFVGGKALGALGRIF